MWLGGELDLVLLRLDRFEEKGVVLGEDGGMLSSFSVRNLRFLDGL